MPVSLRATIRRPARTLVFLGLCIALLSGPAWSQESPEPQSEDATLEMIELVVQPTQPGPDTLCTLTVRLRNGGVRPVSALAFEVQIDGRPLPVYEKQVFMTLVPPTADGDAESSEESTEVRYDLRLFNFWTSDSQRPAPAGGKLDVRVRLVEAQWVDVRVEEDGTEVWNLDGPVPGLPLETALTVPLAQP